MKKQRAKPAKAAQKGLKKPSRSDAVAALVNEKFGTNFVMKASDYRPSTEVRKPCGIPSLDVALAGGYPSGTCIEIAGPDGSGKTALLYASAAEIQRRKGSDARICVISTEGAFDKSFARKMGMIIPYSADELTQEEIRLGRKLTAEEKELLTREVGAVHTPCQAYTGNEVLDAVLKLAALDEYDLILLDSISSLIAEDDLVRKNEEVGVGEERTYNRALNGLVTSFCNRWQLVVKSSKPKGRENLTVCLFTSQVRANVDGYGHGFDWKVGGAFSMKHAKAASILVYKGKVLAKDNRMIGRMVHWKIAKAKYDIVDGARGELPFMFTSERFGYDRAADLFQTLKNGGLLKHTGGGRWELLDRDGKTIENYGAHLGGEDGLIELLRVDPETREKWMSAYELLFPKKPIYEWV